MGTSTIYSGKWLDFCCENINTMTNTMSKIILIFLFSFVLISCKKDNDGQIPENPDWLTEKISQMDTADYYFGTTVYLYEWYNEYYYYVSIPLSSCMMCEFYSYDGVKFVWTKDNSVDFQKNAKRIKVVWQRDLI